MTDYERGREDFRQEVLAMLREELEHEMENAEDANDFLREFIDRLDPPEPLPIVHEPTFTYILYDEHANTSNGEKYIFLHSTQKISDTDFNQMVTDYRYEYKGTSYQKSYSITDVADLLVRNDGFSYTPIAIF